MEDCIEISKKVGKRVGEELGIPVFLYANSASTPERKMLPDIREGEYEALPDKLKRKDFVPDFGEPVFNRKSGATAIGARGFLIAYNINLNSRETKIANKIAKRIREKGSVVKDKETGEKKNIPGLFKGVQGMGWYIDEYKMAQVTVNILDFNESPLYRIFDESEKLANEFGARVTGSELVGLIPLKALHEAGLHYLKKQGASTGVSEREILRIAVQSMGLSEISEFNIDERVIEYRFRKPGRLVSMKIDEFVEELSSDSPAPGGGSVAALCGALSSSLSTMVGNLTYGKLKYKGVWDKMITVSGSGQELNRFFIDAIDKDTIAFNKIMDAFSLPKNSEKDIEIRNRAVKDATIEATMIPFSVLERSKDAAELALEVASSGNTNSLSDSGVAGLTSMAAATGAYYNVLINLEGIEDQAFISKMKKESSEILADVRKITDKVAGILENSFN